MGAVNIGKRELREALKVHGGVIAQVADAFSVSRQTVYNWIDKYQLRDELETSRALMFDLAADNIYQAVAGGNLDMSRFVLTHMPTNKRWSGRAEITGKDGAPLGLSTDVIELMARMGVEPSDVVAQFEAMVRESASINGEV